MFIISYEEQHNSPENVMGASNISFLHVLYFFVVNVARSLVTCGGERNVRQGGRALSVLVEQETQTILNGRRSNEISCSTQY